jgi:hypothetical protein
MQDLGMNAFAVFGKARQFDQGQSWFPYGICASI